MIFSEGRYPLRDHALEHFAAATAALDQPGGGRAGYGRGDPDLQIFATVMRAGGGAEGPRRGHAPPIGIEAYDSSEMSFIYSSCDQARTVLVRTLPSAPTCMQNLAMLSPLADSTMLTRSNWPLVR